MKIAGFVQVAVSQENLKDSFAIASPRVGDLFPSAQVEVSLISFETFPSLRYLKVAISPHVGMSLPKASRNSIYGVRSEHFRNFSAKFYVIPW